MTSEEAVEKFEELSYECAKAVSKLVDIKRRADYINDEMGWDGMFLCDFSEAIEKMANVQAGFTAYALEEKYREKDIKEYKSMVKSLENLK